MSATRLRRSAAENDNDSIENGCRRCNLPDTTVLSSSRRHSEPVDKLSPPLACRAIDLVFLVVTCSAARPRAPVDTTTHVTQVRVAT